MTFRLKHSTFYYARRVVRPPIPSAKAPTPSVSPLSQPAASPAPSSKGKEHDGATASLTPSSLQKDGDEPPVDSAPRVVPPPNPLTSTARGLLEEIDLTGIDQNTLTEDFKVGYHVSFFSFPSIISLGARSALPIGLAPESMFDCM